MEGGWTEDPHDPGGPTNQGITLAIYAAWKGIALDAINAAALKAELKAITPETVRAIYRQRYWRPSGAEAFAPALALMHFDAAVNHGVGAAIRMLQEALGATIDGEIGPRRAAAITRSPAAGHRHELRRHPPREVPGAAALLAVRTRLAGARTCTARTCAGARGSAMRTFDQPERNRDHDETDNPR